MRERATGGKCKTRKEVTDREGVERSRESCCSKAFMKERGLDDSTEVMHSRGTETVVLSENANPSWLKRSVRKQETQSAQTHARLMIFQHFMDEVTFTLLSRASGYALS